MTFAPALRTRCTLDGEIPPSTSISISRPVFSLTSRRRLYMRDGLGHEALPAEARLDRHNEYQVAVIKQGAYHLRVCSRLDRKPGMAAEIADAAKHLGVIFGALIVDGDYIRAGLGELLYIPLRLTDHQMYVEDQPALFADRLDDAGSQRDVGDEHTVHDVDVRVVRARLFDLIDFRLQIAEIAGENGGGNFDHGDITPFRGDLVRFLSPGASFGQKTARRRGRRQ